MSGYGPTGEHFLFTFIAFLVLLGGFNAIALSLLWAPKKPLVRKHEAAPPYKDSAPDRR